MIAIMHSVNREINTGRFAHSKLDRLCRCGHSLGEHTAAATKDCQPCLEESCACVKFKSVRCKADLSDKITKNVR